MKKKEAAELMVDGGSFVQLHTRLFVVVWKRLKAGQVSHVVAKKGPFDMEAAVHFMKDSMDEYGSTFKVVIEPEEFVGWQNGRHAGHWQVAADGWKDGAMFHWGGYKI